jgi:hypothetical protein
MLRKERREGRETPLPLRSVAPKGEGKERGRQLLVERSDAGRRPVLAA